MSRNYFQTCSIQQYVGKTGNGKTYSTSANYNCRFLDSQIILKDDLGNQFIGKGKLLITGLETLSLDSIVTFNSTTFKIHRIDKKYNIATNVFDHLEVLLI